MAADGGVRLNTFCNLSIQQVLLRVARRLVQTRAIGGGLGDASVRWLRRMRQHHTTPPRPRAAASEGRRFQDCGSITDRLGRFLAIPQRWPAGTLQPLAHAWPLPPLLSFFADLRCFCARLPKSDAKAPRLLATGATLFIGGAPLPVRATLFY